MVIKLKQILLSIVIVANIFSNSTCGISNYGSNEDTSVSEASSSSDSFFSDDYIKESNSKIEDPLIKDLDEPDKKYEFIEWLKRDVERIEKYKSQIQKLSISLDYEKIKEIISKLQFECEIMSIDLEFFDSIINSFTTRSGAYVCDYKHTGAKYVVLAAINTRNKLIHMLNNSNFDLKEVIYDTPGLANSTDLSVTKIISSDVLEEEQKFVIDFLNDKRFCNNNLFINLKVYILPFELSEALGVAFNTNSEEPHTVVLCNSDGNYRAVFLHELGHVFTYKVLKMKNEHDEVIWDKYYLPIYSIIQKADNITEVEWKDNIYENFAEEFKIYMADRFDIHDQLTDTKATNFPNKTREVSDIIEKYYDDPDIQYRLIDEFKYPTLKLYDGDGNFINSGSIFPSVCSLVWNPEIKIHTFEYSEDDSGIVSKTDLELLVVITDLISNKRVEYEINNTKKDFKYRLKNYSAYSIELYVAGAKNVSVARKTIIYEDFDHPIKYAF